MPTHSRNPSKPHLIRHIQRLFARREPLNLSAVKRRHPELLARVYAVRPFWGWKQALADAGIDYAKINVEIEDCCTCLICGAEGAILTGHLKSIHELTPDEYREEFPGAEIVSETIRAAKMSARTTLPHWEPVWSWEYVLDRAWELHRRGWSLNCNEIQRRERSLYGFVWAQGRQWDEVLQALGLDPEDIRKQAVGEHLSKADVVRRLKERFRKGKSVASAFVAREDMQLSNAATRRFGRHAEALRAAGFDPEKVQLKRTRITAGHVAEVRAEMTRVASLHGHERAAAASALKKKYPTIVFERLGNWQKACRRFGIRPEDLAVHPYATKEHVIAGLRQWDQVAGTRLRQIYLEDRSLYSAIYKHFGSWRKARKASGVSIFP